MIKGIPKWFSGQVVFGGLGYQGQKTTHFSEKSGVLALPPKAAGPKNKVLLENVWLFGLGAQGLQKNTRPKKHHGIPLTMKTYRCGPRQQHHSPLRIAPDLGKHFGSPRLVRHTLKGRGPIKWKTSSSNQIGVKDQQFVNLCWGPAQNYHKLSFS